MTETTQQGAPADAAVCAACGSKSPSPHPPITWSVGVERGRRIWTCERCSRENIRSIEGKLDSAWW